jgi:hypothetical protein
MNNLSPSVLSDVLVLLADQDDARILPRRPVNIAVERVLAWSWNPGRLERCQRLLAEGEKAPPIHVNRYRLNGLTWYVVSDGRHRTVAAREAGRRRIAAVVGSETECHPGRYRLDVAGRRLWQQHHDDRFGDCLKLAADDLSTETMTALLAAGVPYKEG